MEAAARGETMPHQYDPSAQNSSEKGPDEGNKSQDPIIPDDPAQRNAHEKSGGRRVQRPNEFVDLSKSSFCSIISKCLFLFSKV